ncbi:MAG: M20/M25/M40 family metallo-hydrolase [Actinomycetes bacterium]
MQKAEATQMATRLQSRLAEMIDDTRALVEVESPSSDPEACREAIVVAERLCGQHLPTPARVETHEGCSVLRWGPDTPRVLLLGHLDTVWPCGTLRDIPWSVTVEERGTVLRGPGVFDMKAGAVQAIYALTEVLAHLPTADVGLLLTTDEEIGSSRSKALILESCERAEAALVLEPSIDGALKNARKGTSWYQITVHGRAAHAGLDPASGINAMLAMARLALAVGSLADEAAESTVTPTLASAGTTGNTVPDHATLMLDVRAWSLADQQRIDDGVRALITDDSLMQGAHADVEGGINRHAMPESAALSLVSRVDALCPTLGITYPGARAVGGASDGNITAEAGVPTLDGLGAVGAGAHAIDEWVLAEAMPQRAAIVAALVLDLLTA